MANNWSPETLADLRLIMDKKADEAVRAIFESGDSSLLRTTLSKMATNDSSVLSEYFPEGATPGPLYDLINEELTQTFTDLDIRMFERTYNIWKNKGVKFIYVLFFRSLPFTYAAEKPANVLRMTKLIESQPARRIIETAQFVFDVMDKDWWTPEKRGILTTVKIRLMHASMRYMLLKGEGDEPWNDAWGMPISQEDMIATNQVFSLSFFLGMGILNDTLSFEDQEAWFYTWRKIGKIIGVEQELLMPTVVEGWELQHAIYGYLFNDTHESGIGLAKALVEALKEFLIPERFALTQMKKMMYDPTFKGIFNNVLGPTYATKYPSLFNDEGSLTNSYLEESLYDDFFKDLKDFLAAVHQNRTNQVATQNQNNQTDGTSITDKHLQKLTDLLKEIDKLPLLHTFRHTLEDIKEEVEEGIHKIVADIENLPVVEHVVSDVVKAKDDLMTKVIDGISMIIIDLLSAYFRQGKFAGFRISADLKEHWAGL